MVTYLLTDTCVLSDILKQYNPLEPHKEYITSRFISRKMVKFINKVVTKDDEGYIISSIFAFIELINKFDSIFHNSSVTMERLRSFISQPPSWLIIESMDINTAEKFCDVPTQTQKGEPISSDDAVHIATALQRGDPLFFLTSDHKLHDLNIKDITFIE